MLRKTAVSQGTIDDRSARPSLGAMAGRVGDRLVLAAHALAVRLDRVPAEFGDTHAVDEADARAVRAEWRRQARLWADYNSEALFARKAGALMLAVGVGAVLLLVSVL